MVLQPSGVGGEVQTPSLTLPLKGERTIRFLIERRAKAPSPVATEEG